jgi:hypothetical protein
MGGKLTIDKMAGRGVKTKASDGVHHKVSKGAREYMDGNFEDKSSGGVKDNADKEMQQENLDEDFTMDMSAGGGLRTATKGMHDAATRGNQDYMHRNLMGQTAGMAKEKRGRGVHHKAGKEYDYMPAIPPDLKGDHFNLLCLLRFTFLGSFAFLQQYTMCILVMVRIR